MNHAIFFNALRNGFTGKLEPDEVSGTEAVLSAMTGQPLAFTAYTLATAFHETAGTMQPIKERGGDAYFRARYDPQGAHPNIAKALGNTQPGDGARFAGRGYVQLTGRANYAKAAKETGVDLIAHPDLAMGCGTAASIMRGGMTEGWFTGRALRSYLPSQGPADAESFVKARRIINGMDCAVAIAGYAKGYQAALIKGGWA